LAILINKNQTLLVLRLGHQNSQHRISVKMLLQNIKNWIGNEVIGIQKHEVLFKHLLHIKKTQRLKQRMPIFLHIKSVLGIDLLGILIDSLNIALYLLFIRLRTQNNNISTASLVDILQEVSQVRLVQNGQKNFWDEFGEWKETVAIAGRIDYDLKIFHDFLFL